MKSCEYGPWTQSYKASYDVTYTNGMKRVNYVVSFIGWGPEAVFLVVCDPSMNEL
jgi:hypothetical protein